MSLVACEGPFPHKLFFDSLGTQGSKLGQHKLRFIGKELNSQNNGCQFRNMN